VSDAPTRDELQAWLAAAMERHEVPGLAFTLEHAGRAETLTLGVTSREDPLPVTAQTLFRWGSITKTVTCLAVLRLVERGLLGLDEPVRAYLPDLRLADEAAARSLTVRHLLTHSGGWFDDDRFPDTGPGDDALARVLESMAERPVLLPPGRVSSYGDTHFLIAGRLVEVATGLTYERATQELVLEPLEMKESFFDLAEVVCRRVAAGYEREWGAERAELVRPWPNPRNRAPAIGLTGSLEDMVRYTRFVMGDGRNEAGECVLSPEMMDLMRTPQLVGAFDHWRGLAWNVRDLGGVRFIGHGGTAPGFHTQLLVAPERDFLLCVLANSSDGLKLVTELVDWLRGACLGVVKEEAPPREWPPAVLREYEGRYMGVSGRWWLDVTLRDGQLCTQFSDKERAREAVLTGLCENDVFVALEGHPKGRRGEFLRDDDGVVRWIRFVGRVSMQRV
jgi:CubicO group peptidase (beta-lactamase class C family)